MGGGRTWSEDLDFYFFSVFKIPKSFHFLGKNPKDVIKSLYFSTLRVPKNPFSKISRFELAENPITEEANKNGSQMLPLDDSINTFLLPP